MLYKTDVTYTFVELEVAFLDNVFVESVFCFPSDSVINFSPIHCVRKNLFLVLQSIKKQTYQATTQPSNQRASLRYSTFFFKLRAVSVASQRCSRFCRKQSVIRKMSDAIYFLRIYVYSSVTLAGSIYCSFSSLSKLICADIFVLPTLGYLHASEGMCSVSI